MSDKKFTITLSAPAKLDANRAILKKIEELQDGHDMGIAQPTLSATRTVVTGKDPFRVYVFELTATYASATYIAKFLEEVPDTDDITPESSGEGS